jgi:hypothetical protein
MEYLALSLHLPSEEAIPSVLAALCHSYADCTCDAFCICKSGGSCDSCAFSSGIAGTFPWANCGIGDQGYVHVVLTRPTMMLQVDIYKTAKWGFDEQRAMFAALRALTTDGQVTKIQVNRDKLTAEIR